MMNYTMDPEARFVQEIGPSRRYATWRFVETVCYVCSKTMRFALLWAIFPIASRDKLLKHQWFFDATMSGCLKVLRFPIFVAIS